MNASTVLFTRSCARADSLHRCSGSTPAPRGIKDAGFLRHVRTGWLWCVLIAALLIAPRLRAQDVDSLLNTMTTPATDYATATFKATRIINGHSVEQMAAKQLDVRIHHRFGQVNSGPYELWGLDQSNVFFGFEYGITDWLMAGVGRSTYQKAWNGFTKVRVLRQATGESPMPVAVSAYAGLDINGLKWPDPARTNYFTSRLSYVFQALIARKFSENLSLQISPTLIHRNLVELATERNDMYAMGFGGRFKLTSRISLNAEYFLTLPPASDVPQPINSFSLGFDIETGGHVFQLILTNSLPMIERGFIGETTGRWSEGGIHLGFNISRVFTL